MVVNNWWVTVAMFTNVMADGYFTFLWIRLFFVSFWIGMVLIQLNILIAIVLEIYGSVMDDVKEQNSKESF